MEYKATNAPTQKDDFYCNFENSIKDYLLVPKNIPPYMEIDAYFNLIKGRPNNRSAGKKILAQLEIKKGSLSDDNKGLKYLKEDIQNKNNATDNSSSKVDFKGIPCKVNFGSHSEYSFFEYWAREIVFQLFNYHSMYFFSYKFSKPKLQKMEKIYDFEILESYIRKRDKFIKVNPIEKKNDYGGIKKEKEKHPKNDEQKESNNNNQEKNEESINKIVEGRGLKISKIRTDYKSDNLKDKVQGSLNKIKRKINNDKFEGDIDFVLPNITSNELKRVLNNKDIGPFIFYDYIDTEECKIFDIIGEIKESIDDSDKNIAQLMKYMEMLSYLKISKEVNANLGLNMNNQKVIMYVFNSSYKDYLIKLIEYKKHYTEFTSIDDRFKNCYFEKIIERHGNNSKSILIDIIVNSKIPYIILYLPSTIISWSIYLNDNELLRKEMKQKDDEIKKLNQKVDSLKVSLETQEKEIEDLKNKFNQAILEFRNSNQNKSMDDQSTKGDS